MTEKYATVKLKKLANQCSVMYPVKVKSFDENVDARLVSLRH